MQEVKFTGKGGNVKKLCELQHCGSINGTECGVVNFRVTFCSFIILPL